jgi:hypothetical protein
LILSSALWLLYGLWVYWFFYSERTPLTRLAVQLETSAQLVLWEAAYNLEDE